MQAENVEETQATNDVPQLMMSDLSKALEIIDAAISRGAFKGVEITSVGKCRDHLSEIISYTQENKDDVAEDAAKPSLVPNDIVVTLRVIDVAIERGAFNGTEATTVGLTRDVFAKVADTFKVRESEEKEKEESK